MKKLVVFLFALGLMTSQAESMVEKESALKISYRFWNITEGYDHLSRAVIFINGEEVLVTPDHLQSQPQEITVMVPLGQYELNLVMWALYDGVWEEHLLAYNYSTNCFINDIFESKNEKHSLEIIFDLDRDTFFQYK
jgi:hypothetical protein